jgi:serine/threonine-protein phosphatase PGAM5
MPKRILYLIRHGEYEVSTPEAKAPDGPLTEKGRAQAKLTAQRLKNLPIHAVYFSNLQRAMETGNYIAPLFPKLNPCTFPILRECLPCLPVHIEERVVATRKKSINYGIEKARQAFKTFFKVPEGNKDSCEVIVSHGNLIRYFLAKTIHAPCESWVHIKINHASISEVHISQAGFQKLVRLNDTAHFPDHLRSAG